MDHHQPAARASGLLKRMRGVYGLLSVMVISAIAVAVATPAYAAASGNHPSHIYTIGRQSTLTGAIIILVIAAISIRRNLRRSVGGMVEMSPLGRPGEITRPRAGN